VSGWEQKQKNIKNAGVPKSFLKKKKTGEREREERDKVGDRQRERETFSKPNRCEMLLMMYAVGVR
jgi:hypothetical protein